MTVRPVTVTDFLELLAQCEEWIESNRKVCCTGPGRNWCSHCIKTKQLLQDIHQTLQLAAKG